jgi:hypothetical protein
MRVSNTKSIHGLTLYAAVLTGAVVLALAPTVAGQPEKAPITEAEVEAAQQAWCNGLVNIGKVYRAGGDYKAVARQFIDDLYDYKEGKVFFKPTLASGPHTFRPTKESALSYFIGGNIPGDEGFAVKNHWEKVSYDNNAAPNGIQIHGDIAITMGNVYLIDNSRKKLTVDKTFVFRKCRDGRLRLCVHHSSLPAKPVKGYGS